MRELHPRRRSPVLLSFGAIDGLDRLSHFPNRELKSRAGMDPRYCHNARGRGDILSQGIDQLSRDTVLSEGYRGIGARWRRSVRLEDAEKFLSNNGRVSLSGFPARCEGAIRRRANPVPLSCCLSTRCPSDQRSDNEPRPVEPSLLVFLHARANSRWGRHQGRRDAV